MVGFDCLHVGHVALLNKCRTLAGRCGKVIVVIDSNNKLRADKGCHRPYFSEKERASHIKSLEYPLDSLLLPLIDEVLFFDTNEHLYELIKSKKPDIIVKGFGWKDNVVGSDLAEVVYFEHGLNISTSKIEDRILFRDK